MKTKTLIPSFGAILGIVLLVTACVKEESALAPSDADILYTLPQGNHDYDATILELQKKYGTYFLYKFKMTDVDASPVLSFYAYSLSPLYTLELDDEARVGQLLGFLQRNWLSYYPDAYLTKNLPFKVLIAGALRESSGEKKIVPTFSIYNQICISHAAILSENATEAKKSAFLKAIHREFFMFINSRNMLDIAPEFAKVTDYTTQVNSDNFRALGYLSNRGPFNAATDTFAYIALIVTTPKSVIDSTILSPTIDTKGLIRKKYTLLTQYYKSKLNIDLQAIGDAGTR